uniref:Dynamin-type G domain-containing protein n=1 Tax=Ananas comosus var. bracteatus TaxID=296719 RepID=A0A6V7P1S7_ANACO|nr:unnamed protein product [Ananas comosus var. bracteatus]
MIVEVILTPYGSYANSSWKLRPNLQPFQPSCPSGALLPTPGHPIDNARRRLRLRLRLRHGGDGAVLQVAVRGLQQAPSGGGGVRGEAPDPEIVAVGGQSNGNSSLLEALLGFRFNVREVEMGTRRPLVLQMVHDLPHSSPGADSRIPAGLRNRGRSSTFPNCRIASQGPSLSNIELIEECFGPQCHNHIICHGGGLKRNDMKTIGTRVELQAELRETQKENDSLKSRMDEMEAEIKMIKEMFQRQHSNGPHPSSSEG